VTIEILDSTRKVVRTLRPTARAGLNRTYWDLESDETPAPRMRTKPMHNEEFELDAAGTRPAPGFGGFSILMPPGRYTVRLTVPGMAPQTQPLTVIKDPHNMATLAEVHEQYRALAAIQRDHAQAAQMLNTIERVRAQIAALKPQLGADAAGADSLEGKFMAVESRLVDLRMTGRGQDGVRWPVKLAGQLGYLAGTISSSDFAPTAQQKEVAVMLAKETRDVDAALRALISKDLADYNATLRSKNLKPIEAEPVVP
jgi:hypothetical protein